MSVCGTVLMPAGPSEPAGQTDIEVSSLERELQTLDENRSWSLFYERIQNLAFNASCKLTFVEASASQNRWKNRYRDIIPYDETRVHLKSESTGDYINANFVKINELPSRRYILTQGPLASTTSHFWQMVWEQNCPVIVMLNRFFEKGANKCFEYFPDLGQTREFPDTEFRVTCISQENKGLYTHRTLQIVNKASEETREVQHFHYTRWPDFGVPDYSSSMLNLLWDVRRTGFLDNPDRPSIVHCSAGVGRSGTFVLTDLALAMIEQQGSMEGVDLGALLVKLRQCRMGIIQTAQQLRYSYVAVVEGARLLLATPPADRASLVFPEHDRLSGQEVGSDSSGSDIEDADDIVDDDDDDEGDLEGDDDDDASHGALLQHLFLQGANSHLHQSNYLFSAHSDASSEAIDSIDEENEEEEEIVEAFGGLREPKLRDCSDELKTQNGSVMPSSDSGADTTGNSQTPPLPAQQEQEQIGDLNQPENEEPPQKPPADNGDDRDKDNEEEDPERSIQEEEEALIEALRLREQLRQARCARRERTRARLEEITARMAQNEMLRRRWLPEGVLRPLRNFYTRWGLFENASQAAYFTFAVLSAVLAVSVGLWRSGN